MDFRDIFWLLVTMTSVSSGQSQGKDLHAYECGDKPADIIFILDSSSSIQAQDYQSQLSFVNDVIAMFDVSPTKTQFGSVSFSNWAFLDFHLNSFRSKGEIQGAVSSIRQIKGDTNTAAAIAYVNDVMLTSENGARRGIPHIAIVLTDGKSNEHRQTAAEAGRARGMGIHMFAIGVGQEVTKGELKSIASWPHKDHVFKVDDYSALQEIKNKLAIKTCQATDLPVPRPPYPGMIVDQACGDAAIADVVFAAAAGGSPQSTEQSLAFFRDVSLGFDISENRVHVGLVPRDCHNVPEINIGEYYDKDSVMNALDNLMSSEATPATVLRYMREKSFSVEEGARPKAKRIGVVIIDGPIHDFQKTLEEAVKLQSLAGVELFVVGVGKVVNPAQLVALATKPAEQHVFHVTNYEDLRTVTHRVRNAICPVPAL